MLDIQALPGAENLVQQRAHEFTSAVTALLAIVDSTVIDLARLAYHSLPMIGLLLYYTHVERRWERDLVKEGVALAIVSEFVFPRIMKL